MDYETLLYDLSENIATITLNRPDVLNGLTTQMRAEILHAIKTAEDEARVLVLTGSGRGFCAGQDLGSGATVADIDLESTLRDEYIPMIQALINCRIPSICAVNGIAAGAGANLALAADVVIATQSASFLQAFSRIGLIPDVGGTYFLPRQIGTARAMGAALFAEPVSASKAVEWGMIWEAVPDAEFVDVVRKRALHLANGPTEGYRLIKRALRMSAEQTLDQQLETESHLQGKAGKTFDFREGVMAFLEKREARFEGR